MLHLLAKQVIAEQKFVRLPAVIPEYGDKTYKLYSPTDFRPTEVVLEPWMGGIRPDIVARDNEHSKELLVEIYVTHPCGPEKIELIRARKIAAIEIDLSRSR